MGKVCVNIFKIRYNLTKANLLSVDLQPYQGGMRDSEKNTNHKMFYSLTKNLST